MTEKLFCQNCTQSESCQEIYRRLGSVKSPSVTVRVVFAFLVPMLVFVTALAVFPVILPKLTNIDELLPALSFLLAVLVSLVAILTGATVSRKIYKNNR